jgi:PKD repeat protein
LRAATIDFGDGTSQSLGNLAGGTLTATHTYEGPSGTTNRTYTATVLANDINGESAAVSTTVVLTPRSRQLNVAVTATPGTAVIGVGQPVNFEATVTPTTGGADMVQTYRWQFGDGTEEETTSNRITHVYKANGVNTVTVTVTTTDGRTASATTQFITSGI